MSSELEPYSPESARRIDELTAKFLASRKSDHTRDAYRRDVIGCWWQWCAGHRLNPLEAWPSDILVWLADLKAGVKPYARRPEAGTTRARRLASVSSWYMWLIREGAAERNPTIITVQERPVRAPRKAPALDDDQTEKLLAQADDDKNPRTPALVWLLVTTGIRVGELCAADVADIGMDRGVTVLHVKGKGGKGRMVEIEPSTVDRVNSYLSGRDDVQRLPVLAEQAGAGAPVPLIVTETGRRITRHEVRRLLRRLADEAGLPEMLVQRICPHSTRATFVTTSLEDGVPVRDVQRAVGHVSPVTTEGYDRSQFTPDRSPSRRVARRFHADRLDARRKGQHDES